MKVELTGAPAVGLGSGYGITTPTKTRPRHPFTIPVRLDFDSHAAGLRPGAGPPGPGRHQGARPGGLRPPAARAGPDPGLAAQRLRLLHRHAHQGRPRDRRDASSACTRLAAWRDTPFFTERERAALAFTEAVTLMAGDHVPDAAYEAVAAHYSPDEVAALLALIVTINAWNADRRGHARLDARQLRALTRGRTAPRQGRTARRPAPGPAGSVRVTPQARRARAARLLQVQQRPLAGQATGVAGQLAGAAHHPVARDQDAQRVAAYRGADVPGIRVTAEPPGQVPVAGGRARTESPRSAPRPTAGIRCPGRRGAGRTRSGSRPGTPRAGA